MSQQEIVVPTDSGLPFSGATVRGLREKGLGANMSAREMTLFWERTASGNFRVVTGDGRVIVEPDSYDRVRRRLDVLVRVVAAETLLAMRAAQLPRRQTQN